MLLAILALLIAGVLAPFITARRLSANIRDALEASLGRKVTFERAYFTIFSGPGFSLENVTIAEDARFGIEPFAYVPVLEARLRLDKLLLGQIRFANLRLVNPSLNLVRNGDGSWNAVALMQRLTAPRRLPLNLFPSFEVSQGRVDFKFGTRKTILYISESDLSIYPQRSGKIYLRFSGSPARTDRAGMGFGHFRGGVTWLQTGLHAEPRLKAELFLDPSNLSELTTLVEGHDVGVHGTVSSRLYVEGPSSALNVSGEVALNEVHRWDLLPATGETWTVRYGGQVDLLAHSVDIRTLAPKSGQPAAISMHLRVNDFLNRAGASVVTELNGAPLRDLLSLASRMGVVLPPQVDLRGAVSGAVSYSNGNGWSGGLNVADAEAAISGSPVVRAPRVEATVAGDRIHFAPAALTVGIGSIELSGDYNFSDQHATASLTATDASVIELGPLANSWFGGLGPLASVKNGTVTGQLSYVHNAEPAGRPSSPEAITYSGQFTLNDGVVGVAGLPLPLEGVHARVSFRDASFEWDHVSALLGGHPFRASYRFNPFARRTERARIEFVNADLAQLDQALSSASQPAGFWARLRFGRRSLPAWLVQRDLEGDFLVDHLSAAGQTLGGFRSHFTWQGANLNVDDLSLRLKEGVVSGSGSLDMLPDTPRWQFSAQVSGFPWAGGWLNADGRFATAGSGEDLARNLTATGSFSGEDLALSTLDAFGSVSGQFQFSFADGWPDLRLSNIQALQHGEEWTGDGVSQRDGKLLVNLAHEGRELHLTGSLTGDGAGAPLSTLPNGSKQALFSLPGLRF